MASIELAPVVQQGAKLGEGSDRVERLVDPVQGRHQVIIVEAVAHRIAPYDKIQWDGRRASPVISEEQSACGCGALGRSARVMTTIRFDRSGMSQGCRSRYGVPAGPRAPWAAAVSTLV